MTEQAQPSFSQTLEILEQLIENIDDHPARIDIFKMIDEETIAMKEIARTNQNPNK